MTSFLVVSRSGEQKVISSPKKAFRIGRGVDNEIFVDDPLVSRRHAKVLWSGDRCYLQDTGSTNGTSLNGTPVAGAVELSPGDVIGVGGAEIRFEPPEKIEFPKEPAHLRPPSATLPVPPPPDNSAASLALLRAVSEIAGQIVEERPLEGLLDAILRLCMDRTVAERGAILLTDRNGELQPSAYLSKAAPPVPFAMSRTIVRKAVAERKAVLIKDVAVHGDLSGSESVIGLKIRSAICTPLWHGGKMLGVLYVDNSAPLPPFGDVELLFFSTLSGMISERIENAMLADVAKEKQRLDEELGVAHEIQSRLFPLQTPAIAGYQLATFNRPCTEMEGDYFDILAVGKEYGIAIADVIGKGIGAAMLMSNLQATLNSLAAENPDPGELLQAINAELASRVGEGRFITCCYVLLKPEEGRILYANAGHNKPLLCRRNGGTDPFEVSGIPLGILAESSYQTFNEEMGPGDVLLLYTDGFVECGNKAGELFGEERLLATLTDACAKDAEGIKGAICSAVETFLQGNPCSDDMTMVVLKRQEAGG